MQTFFELGGDSLKAIRLKMLVENLLRVNIPLSLIFSYPTVSQLAENLRTVKEYEYCALVPLQTASGEHPLFCIHPINGHVMSLLDLAKEFRQRPVYGLQCKGFDSNEECFADIHEMVSTYIKAIKAVQPYGPYNLVVGYSFGAEVVFEIARELESEGEVINFLGLIDLPPSFETHEYTTSYIDLLIYLDQVIAWHLNEKPTLGLREVLDKLTLDQQLDYLIENIHVFQIMQFDKQSLKKNLRVIDRLCKIHAEHLSSGTVEKIVVFEAEENIKTRETEAHFKEWQSFSRKQLSHHVVPGNHFSIVKQPSVKLLAELIESAIQGNKNVHVNHIHQSQELTIAARA